MTSLYIKQHNKTGLKYFGKTDNTDPVTYLGSGSYWKNHLAIHGNDVSTIWYQKFNSKEELTKYAMDFSVSNNIVEAKDADGKNNPNALEWEIHYPNGEIVKVKGLREFCRKNNLSFGNIYYSKNGWKSVKYGSGKGGRQKNAY
jgi:hypothetical protein